MARRIDLSASLSQALDEEEDTSVLLRLDDLEKRIGDRVLFEHATAVVRAGDRIGVVGPNGAGKTTFLKTLIGDEPTDGGEIHRARTTRLGMLKQEIDPRASHSVRAEARTALAELDALEDELRRLEDQMSERGSAEESLPASLTRRYDELSHRFKQAGGFERHARVSEILSGLGFSNEESDRPLSTFSGGWLMRVELAKLLLGQPEILLLDEPTRGIDIGSKSEIYRLMHELAGQGVAIVFASSDMEEILGLSDRVLVMHQGRMAGEVEREQLSEELILQMAILV